jgi:hypothetical protein
MKKVWSVTCFGCKVLPTVRQRGWVKIGGGGVRMMVFFGGGIRPHTRGWQTTKKWEADNLAKGRFKCRREGGGEDNQVGTVGCVSLMAQHHTNYVVSLMTT